MSIDMSSIYMYWPGNGRVMANMLCNMLTEYRLIVLVDTWLMGALIKYHCTCDPKRGISVRNV